MLNVPKLRFGEFEGEWVEKKLGDISEKIGSGKTPKGGDKVYLKEGIPFIRSQNVIENKLVLDDIHISEDIHKEMQNSKVFVNDILLNITGGSIGRSCIVPTNFLEGNVNQHVSIIRLKEDSPKFVQSILSSWRGQKLIFQGQTGSGREGLNFQSIKGFKIKLPQKQEQQKISTYLTSIDQKTEQLTQKKTLLESYKKGVMQKIFSQEIRFKRDDGGEFEDWEFKHGNEVFETISNKKHNSDLPILAISQKYGAIPRELIDYEINVSTKSVDSYKVVEVGDFIISLRSFQGGIEYSNYLGICSPAYIILRQKIEINRDFFKFYLKTHSYIQELKKKLEGIRDGKMISYKYFSEIKLPLPCLEEQQKISTFLTSLDQKITQTTQQIEAMKSFKKGLLQGMFV